MAKRSTPGLNDAAAKSIISAVLSEYGWSVQEIRPVPSLYRPSAAWCVHLGERKILLKPYRRSERRFRSIWKHVDCLLRSGYRHMPQWFFTRRGYPWVLRAGVVYYATEWIDGAPLSTDAHDFERLGRALARLHRHREPTQRTHPVEWTANITRGPQLNALLQNLRHTTAKDPELAAAAQWLEAHAEEVQQMTERAHSTLGAPDVREMLHRRQTKPSRIHGDVTRPNVLVHQHRVILLDWERLRWGNPLEELARTLANTADFNPDRMTALLRGYEQIRPLSTVERRAVAAYFSLPREAWSTARQLAAGTLPPTWPGIRDTWAVRQAAIAYLDAAAVTGTAP